MNLEEFLSKKRVLEILMMLYLRERLTRYEIAKSLAKYNTRSAHYLPAARYYTRRLEDLGIIKREKLELKDESVVRKFYVFTPKGREVFLEFKKREIKNILKDAMELGFDVNEILKEIKTLKIFGPIPSFFINFSQMLMQKYI